MKKMRKYDSLDVAEMPDDRPFRLRVYRKSELALLYFPYAKKKQALNNLGRWIKKCTELHDALHRAGYVKNRWFFLRPEVELIVRYLGEP